MAKHTEQSNLGGARAFIVITHLPGTDAQTFQSPSHPRARIVGCCNNTSCLFSVLYLAGKDQVGDTDMVWRGTGVYDQVAAKQGLHVSRLGRVDLQREDPTWEKGQRKKSQGSLGRKPVEGAFSVPFTMRYLFS